MAGQSAVVRRPIHALFVVDLAVQLTLEPCSLPEIYYSDDVCDSGDNESNVCSIVVPIDNCISNVISDSTHATAS